MQSRQRVFSRVFIATSVLHALATLAAFSVLLYLTSGGGEGYKVSPAIDAAGALLDALAVPAAWLVELLLDPGRRNTIPFPALACLRLLNSLVVGALAASLWTGLGLRAE